MRDRRSESGAVAVFLAAAMTLLLLMAAFAVDLGVQRVLKRDLQAMADVVALDMTRQLDGRTHAQIKATNDWRSQLEASVARNLGVRPSEVRAQQQQEDAVATVSGQDTVVTATMGYLDDGQFKKLPYPQVPTAVQVVTRSTVDFRFAQVIGVSKGGAGASAVGTSSTPTVCFSVGARTLALSTSGSGLSPLLDRILSVNLSAVGYTGIADLADVSVPLAGLLTELNVGSTSGVATTTVGLGPLVVAVAEVLRADGQTLAAEVLEDVSLRAPGAAFALGKILSLGTATAVSGLTADLDVLDLLSAAVMAANGQNGVDIGVPGVTRVRIIEPPQVACGGAGTVARSAQIRLDVASQVPANATLGVLGASVDVPVEVGRGSATLTALGCDPDQVSLAVSTGAVAVLPPASEPGHLVVEAGLGVVNDILRPLDPLGLVRGALALLGLGRITVDGSLTAAVAASSGTSTVTYPAAPALPAPVVVPASGAGQVLTLTAPPSVRFTPGRSSGLVAVLDDLLNPVLSGLLGTVVTPLVDTVVNPLVSGILDPALDLLGIKLGVAEVDLLGRPDCETVRLTR